MNKSDAFENFKKNLIGEATWPNMYSKLSFPSQNTSQKEGPQRPEENNPCEDKPVLLEEHTSLTRQELIHELLSCNHHSSPWTHFADQRSSKEVTPVIM